MRYRILIILTSLIFSIKSQIVVNIYKISSPAKTENIYNKQLFSDSLVSRFCIVIKNEVKLHKHEFHSEHVMVMEGEGKMH